MFGRGGPSPDGGGEPGDGDGGCDDCGEIELEHPASSV